MEDSEKSVFEFESKSSFSFTKTWEKMKTALMGTLFVMANDMELSYKMNLLAILIDFLQILAFPFNQNSGFPWSPQLTNWLVILCNNIQLEFYISATNPLQNLIIFIISVFLVFLNLIVIGIVAYKFINKKAQNVFLLKMLRSVTSLLTTIFFMPVLSIFIMICSCSLNRSTNPLGCPSDDSKVLLIASLVFSVLLCVISLVVAASFYELDYKSDDASARPHARIELIYLLGKMFLTVVFKLFEQSQYHLIQIISILFVGILVTFLYVVYLPFYDYSTSVFQAQCIAIYTWSGFCLALAMIVNDPKQVGPPMLFYLGSPCIWVLTKDTCDWWRRKLVAKSIFTVKNPYQVELHARFMMLERAGTYKTDEEQLLTESEDFYYQAERKFPDSSLLKIFVAQFHLTYRDRQEAIPKLEQAEMRSPALDEQFIIYKTRQNVGKDAITLVTFTSYLESSSKSEILALTYQLEFWRALSLKSVTNDDLLISLSKNITKNIDNSFNNYKFMLSIDRTHKKMVPMYVYFMEDVLHRVDGEVKNLKNRFRDMDHGPSKAIMANKFEQQPRISISLEKTNFGMIDKVNAEMISWIRMPKAKIMNQRIEALMPYYYGQCFISYLTDIKEKWDELLGPPPVEMYFIDNDELIIACTCNFILENEDTSARYQGKTSQSSMNIESRSNSYIPKMQTMITQPKQYENWHRPINCILVPRDDSESIIFISSDYIIMGYNAKASAFFGMNNEMIGLKNIKDFISNFDGLFERVKKNTSTNYGMLNEFSPVQTFLISNSGTFSRIRISINSYCVDNNVYYILVITEPGSYSKPTQRFFGLFIKFLEVYLKKGGYFGGLIDDEDGGEESDKIDKLLVKVRKEVETKNNQRSPELHYLSILMWVFMILMMAAFGGSYAVSVISFNSYISQIDNLDYLTDIRVQSSLINTYVIMLDMARQGFETPESEENLRSLLKQVSENTLEKVDYIKKHSHVSDLNKKSLKCVSFKYLGGYENVMFNPINALIQQSSYALKLCERDLNNFDVLNNSYAFWVFFNGNQVIRNSLDDLSEKFVKSAENSRQAIEEWAYTFASIEICLIFTAMFISLPLILKSEELNMKVIRVFYTLPSTVLSYLQAITKIHLEMRKDKHYPDNRNRYQSAEDLWEEFSLGNEKNRKFSLTKIQESHGYKVTCWKKFRAFSKNSFTKRLVIYCIISAGVSWGLQTYVGVIMPTYNLNSAATIIKNSGLVAAFQSQVCISLMSELIFFNESVTEIMHPSSEYLEFFRYPTVESSYYQMENDSNYLEIYTHMQLHGNTSLGVSHKSIYYLLTNHFLKDFFPSSCPSYVNNCSYYHSATSKGYVYLIRTSLIDSSYISNVLFDYSSKSPKIRESLVQPGLNDLLKLQYSYINITSYEIEHYIIRYFTNMVRNYNSIQEIVLILYYIFCLSYMLFIFRRTLIYHERKKKMTRSMLLLLPHRIVEYSSQIQRALENMNYD